MYTRTYFKPELFNRRIDTSRRGNFQVQTRVKLIGFGLLGELLHKWSVYYL